MLIKKIVLLSASFFCIASSHAADSTVDKFHHPFYVGAMGGYGATTWEGLVPKDNHAAEAMIMSTPTQVEEGGAVWGFFAGYEFIPTFGIEATYMRYTDATVYFDPMSLFTFNNDGQSEFTTHTETVSLMGKFFVFIPRTTVRVYSSIGIAGLHRYDELVNCWRATPTFGLGINYNFTDHIMGEIGGNFTSGYGESELEPSQDYVPFLYSGFIRVAYRF